MKGKDNIGLIVGQLGKNWERPSSQSCDDHVGGRSSIPGTPSFTNYVHFDTQLVHVRQFLSTDRPLAISTGGSPVETTEMAGVQPLAEQSGK